MGPGDVFSCDDCYYTGDFLGLTGVDSFDLGMGPRAEKDLTMKHVWQDEIIPIHRFTGHFFISVNAPHGLTYDTEL
jgi:hypothetical protein